MKSWTFASLACVLATAAAGSMDAAPTQADIQRYKAATALVDLGARGSGSAFCLRSEDGIFVTNRHVVRGAPQGKQVKLVLNPGQESQTVVPAAIVSVSSKYDLALLKLVGSKDDLAKLKLPAFALGEEAKLFETMPVMAIGYPFGRMLAHSKSGYPSPSINTGKVSALRKKDGALTAIQIDARVNPGNSGGPLLDDSGKVVGVIVSGFLGTSVSFAVPVKQLKEFLDQPGVTIPAAKVRYVDLRKPLEVNAEVFQFSAGSEPVELDLTFRSAGVDPRRFHAVAKENRITLQAPPLPPRDKPAGLTIYAKVGDRITKMHTTDQPFRVGSKTLRLVEVRWVERREQGLFIVSTVYGKKYAGPVSRLENLRADAGPPMTDSSKIDRFEVYSDEKELPALHFTAKITRGTDTLAVIERPIRVIGVPTSSAVGLLDEIIIEAFVDEESNLHVTPGGLYWNHRSGTKPGLPHSDGRFVLVNDKRWHIRWLSSSPASREADRSAPYAMKIGTAKYELQRLWTRSPRESANLPRGKVEGRYVDGEFVVSIYDGGSGGAWYRFRLIRANLGLRRRNDYPEGRPVAHWKFDTTAIGATRDATGRGNALKPAGKVSIEKQGKLGAAAKFAAEGDLIVVPGSGDVNLAAHAQRSMSLWFKVDDKSPADRKQAIWVEGTRSRGLNIYIHAGRLYVGGWRTQGGWAGSWMSTDKIRSGIWHHVALVLDGEPKPVAKGFRAFLDGVEFDTASAGILPRRGRASIGAVAVRTRFHDGEIVGPGAWFTGLIDDVRVYNRTITAEHIAKLAAGNKTALTKEKE